MRTASDRATDERDFWVGLAQHWDRANSAEVWSDRRPSEKAVVIFHDPTEDLNRRASLWNHQLSGTDLGSLALFAAGLAAAEGDAWERGIGDIATRAYEDRRFLVGDRLVHWAVPWLDTVGRCYPAYGDLAHSDCRDLLQLAEEMRVAPALAGQEGLQLEGEDAYGPVEMEPGDQWLRSLWSGALILDAAAPSEASPEPDLSFIYDSSAERWKGFATQHVGSARLWLDLAARAQRTAEALTSGQLILRWGS